MLPARPNIYIGEIPRCPVVVFSVSGRMSGIAVSTVGSGMLVSGTGTTIVSVGIALLVLGTVLVEGVVAGALLVQAQAHRESAKVRHKTKMAIFFIKILLFFDFRLIISLIKTIRQEMYNNIFYFIEKIKISIAIFRLVEYNIREII